MFRMNMNRYNASSGEYRVRGTATVYFFRILSGSGKHAICFFNCGLCFGNWYMVLAVLDETMRCWEMLSVLFCFECERWLLLIRSFLSGIADFRRG